MQTESQNKTWSDDKLKVRDGKLRRPSNNHHVVPLGILVVLSTIYLMIAGLQINYVYYFKSGVDAVEISKQNDSQEPYVFPPEERNFEEPPLCRKLEIFSIQVQTSRSSSKRQKLKILKNGNGLATGSRPSKTLAAHRKRDIAKKSNTAEPIIYLFALVFIYLLLKAASDINQHYKSSKGDKRLRRCSLQSYAQKDQRSAHLDRRASKVAPLQSRQHIFSEVRSVSLDRCKQENGASHKIRKQISIGDQSRTYQAPNKYPTELQRGRRLSVPISINYQTINMSPIVHPELARRGSVISLGSLADINTSIPGTISTSTPDAKRRVRMINRH
ncbi:uncharacterized protein LOC132794235 [Drosophila nasuta]|uniref:uncharacterized protein LOC132794235 n=1 Tax=Drosophila nasuta TaxID=42062 RepID=UPI00295E54FA|nr:uncharacterized protein LOC132794235 [Drosophila nasuta]